MRAWPRPAHRDHSRPHLTAEHAAIGASHHAGAVDKRLDLRRNIGHVGRRTEQNTVRRHLFDVGVPRIVVLRTPPVFAGRAFAARQAPMDLRTAQLHEFGFNAFLFHFAEHVAKQYRGITAPSRTAVKSDHLHIRPAIPKLYSLSRRRPASCGCRMLASRAEKGIRPLPCYVWFLHYRCWRTTWRGRRPRKPRFRSRPPRWRRGRGSGMDIACSPGPERLGASPAEVAVE